MAYSILGKAVADNLTVGATGFTDVDSDRWSTPYISYLVGKGIINGMGDGTFAPTANVTGYEFSKMMLRAAGYGAKGEFTGSGWKLAVVAKAQETQLFAGAAAGLDLGKAATREEAMLYAFNGITRVPLVNYNPAAGDYAVGTAVLADTAYPTLHKEATVINGLSGYTWQNGGKPITSFILFDTAVIGPENSLFVLGETADGTEVLFANGTVNTLSAAQMNGSIPQADLFYTYAKNADGSYALESVANQSQLVAAGNTPLAQTSVKHIIRNDTPTFLRTFGTTPQGEGAYDWSKISVSPKLTGTGATAFTYWDPIALKAEYFHGIANASGYTAEQAGSFIAYMADTNDQALWVVGVGGTTEPDRDFSEPMEENPDFPEGERPEHLPG